MSLASPEALVEQRVTQLEAISIRRNELLRQMYYMMRRRNNTGAVVDFEEADDGDLQSFLQRFDIGKDLDMGSITHLNETELFLRNQSQHSSSPRTPSPTLDRSTRRATRSQSRFASIPKSPSPSLSKKAVTPPLGILKAQSAVEQELTQDVPVSLALDKLDSSSSPLSDDEKQEQDTIEKIENTSCGKPSTPLPESPEVTKEMADGYEVEAEAETVKVDEEVIMEAPTPVQPPAAESTRSETLQKLATEDSDADMENVEDVMEVGSEEEVSRTVDRPSLPPLHSTSSPSSKEPIKSSIPFMHLGPSSPIPATPIPRLPVILLAAENPVVGPTSFTFEGNLFSNPDQPKPLPSTLTRHHHYSPDYSLPSLRLLPSEFNRKVKTKSRRREKEKERDKDHRDYAKKDDWFPMGINKWAATLSANPVWKRVSRPTKCLSSREWGVAITELKLIRTFDRIESLKDSGRWSFRQPKKQRGVGGLVKTHWDYLMDEMKWMRIDFREERRWKMALAHTLATAVMEWHAAGSLGERVLRGICVLWKPPHVGSEKLGQDAQDDEMTHETSISQESQLAGHTSGTSLGVDLDAEEDDQSNVVDVLQPQAMLEDALEVPFRDESQTHQEGPIQPKTEETDDAFALQGVNESMNHTAISTEKDIKDNVTGLKSTSHDPILGAKANSNSSSSNGDSDTPASSTRSSLRQIYTPLRERLLESEISKLFLDLDDFHITPPTEDKEDSIELDLPPADLSTIFPELLSLKLSDVVPSPIPVLEGRKKVEKRSDRDDPNKRIEDTTYTKLFPIGQFMHKKPTLIGPLQPSKNWKDGNWLPLDEPPIHVDYDGPTRPPENYMSDIFDNRLSNSTVLAQQQLMLAAARERDRDRKRTTEQQWSVNDDTLLKSLIDRFPYNWQLISESFNATRVTAPADKKTARDCFERWREKWAPEGRRHPEAPSQTAPAPAVEESATVSISSTSPMTTRGVKRLASSMAGTPTVNAGGSEPKKRRRHILLQETIRKSVKKKAEFQQKMLSNQRKPSSVHDTHVPFNTMRYYSPAELSRMKADKDTKATQEVQLRRRQEEAARANIQARLTPAQQQSLVQQQQQLQQQLLQQQQQQQQQQQSQPSQQPGTPAQLQQQSPQPGQQTPQQVSTPTQPATNTQPATQQVPPAAQVANIAQRTQSALLGNQTPGNFRGQINISRFNSPNIAAGVQRLTTQQILQLQQARPGSQPAQNSQGAAHQLGQQGHIIMPSLNGNGTTLNGAHLTTSFINRDSTSSPAHVSPPRKSATPTNVNSPRVTPDQVQHGAVQIGLVPSNQGPGNAMARPPANLSYLPGLTAEQLNAIRLQLMHQQQQQQQQGNTQQDGSAPTQ